jgi:spore coat protein U-like protein
MSKPAAHLVALAGQQWGFAGMKHSILRGLAIAAAASALPGAAWAGTATSSLSVSATVTSNCTVSTSAVGFGSINPLSGSNTDATGGITVTCTNGTPWTAAAGVGGGTGATFASRLMTAGANTLTYSLYTNSGRTTVWGDGSGTTATVGNTGTGSSQSVTIYGRVPSGQISAPPGSYADTVTVTVTY